jgi:hypothetical protein
VKRPKESIVLTTRNHFALSDPWQSRHGPIVDVLRDGRQFWDEFSGTKKNFSFGSRKAQWGLKFIDIVKEFVDSSGRLPGSVREPKTSVRDGLRLTWYADFRRHGQLVEKPYLSITDGGRSALKFGQAKAEALLLVEVELREFVRANK